MPKMYSLVKKKTWTKLKSQTRWAWTKRLKLLKPHKWEFSAFFTLCMGKIVNNTSLMYRHKTEHPLIEHSFERTVSINIELPRCTSRKQLPWDIFWDPTTKAQRWRCSNGLRGPDYILSNSSSNSRIYHHPMMQLEKGSKWRLVRRFQRKAGDTR